MFNKSDREMLKCVHDMLNEHHILETLKQIQHTLCGMGELLAKVECRLESLERKADKIMAVADEIKAAIAALDTETTAIANNITALVAKITNSMTDAELAEIKANFGVLGTRLTSLGVDPTVPVPPPPPPLTALRRKL